MRLIDLDDDRHYYCGEDGEYQKWNIDMNVSTVDAEPVRHGKWIEMSDADGVYYACSVCHSWIPEEQHYYARYCLHCGARMDVKE